MALGTEVGRWTFTVSTPLGSTRSTFEVTAHALVFECDDALGGGSETVRWESILEGGTAATAGMGGRGGPHLPDGVPEQLEWLVLSRTGNGARGFVRRLPPGAVRDAIVDSVRSRLGARWIGEHVPLKDAQQRLGLASGEWGKAKVAGLVIAVLDSVDSAPSGNC